MSSKFLTLQDFCKKYQWPRMGTLRVMIRDKDYNSCFIRYRRRILVDEIEIFEIIEKLGRRER